MPPDRLHALFGRHRVGAAVAIGSVAVHLLLLGVVGMKAGLDMSGWRAPPEPIYVRIEPRPLMRGETRREPALTVIDEPREAPARLGVASPLRLRDEDDAQAAEAQADPPPRIVIDSRAQGVDPVWRVQPGGDGVADRVARGLRASGLGCNRPLGEMTPVQRAACEERLAATPAGPPIPGSGDAARDATFARQGAAAIARYEAQRAPLAGGAGVVGPADCVGSNLGMGCAGAHLRDVPGVDMRQGATTNIRQPGNRVD